MGHRATHSLALDLLPTLQLSNKGAKSAFLQMATMKRRHAPVVALSRLEKLLPDISHCANFGLEGRVWGQHAGQAAKSVMQTCKLMV
jgi:hypothetical protein